ncbi:MAG: Kae1-associated serine/threonine protein kinase [Nanoarchaeota archaeon]|nr:Kae1-associated serine/threonine protein kinase [Nanoarchaeota archaeon]
MSQKLIAQGAEAKIILSNNLIIKDRIKKSYRIPELDEKIRKLRTRAETKLLTRASQIINCPVPLITPSSSGGREGKLQSHKIEMPFVDGKKLSEHLDDFPLKKQKEILKQIGKDVAKLHAENIIHGDLTTSNMILVENLPAHSHSQINKNFVNKKSEKSISLLLTNKKSSSLTKPLLRMGGRESHQEPKIFLIDFGLGYFNGKYEDKAVDIHLLKQALEAKHFKHWKELYSEFEKGYKSANQTESKKILERLKAVEKRGRYKH